MHYFVKHRYDLSIVVFLLFGLFITSIIFWPAINGPFLLDDLVHLPLLKESPAETFDGFLNFVFSSDRTPGRVLSYLSLLIEDNAWPMNPKDYKYTNLMFHLVNGLLVFTLTRLLARDINPKIDANHVGLFCAFIWMIHPIQISTVMYVIQRITILSSTFILSGLILFVYGRRLLLIKPNRSIFLMSFGLGFLGLVSIFFKEIGINILIFTAVLELAIYKKNIPCNYMKFKIWKLFFVYIPLIIVVMYFFFNYKMLESMLSRRDFTVQERLLTESRVLWDYIFSILFPRMSALTLYHDDYQISRSLLHPISTIVAVLTLIASVFLAIILRKKLPLLFLAVLWFLGGHLLESTFLPIELYFEHRNYLPMLGIIIAISIFLFETSLKFKKVIRVVAGFYSFILIFMCLSTAKVWGDSELLANVWAHEHSDSTRAVFDMVRLKSMNGNDEEALLYLEKIRHLKPGSISPILFESLLLGCKVEVNKGDMQSLISKARVMKFDLGVFIAIMQLNREILKNSCDSITIESYISLVDALIENPNFYGYKKGLSLLYESNARLYRAKKDLNMTMQYLDNAYEASPRVEIATQQAVILASAGLFIDAKSYLEKAKQTKRKIPLIVGVRKER